MAECCEEHPRGGLALARVRPCPADWIGDREPVQLLFVARFQCPTDEQPLTLTGEHIPSAFDVIEPRISLERLDSPENRVVVIGRVDRDLGQLFLAVSKMTMMGDPLLPEDLRGPGFVHGRSVWPGSVAERVSRRAEADDRLARLRVPGDPLTLFVRQL